MKKFAIKNNELITSFSKLYNIVIKEFGEIEIEMIPIPIKKRDEYGNKFINIPNKDRKYYHIHFDNDIINIKDSYISKK